VKYQYGPNSTRIRKSHRATTARADDLVYGVQDDHDFDKAPHRRPVISPVVFLTAYRTEPARLLMLIRRVASDDRDAFTRLYDALVPDVTATVRALLKDNARAGEITAATFLEAWQSADLHTAPGTDVAAWIHDIAARRAAEPDDPRRGSHPSTSGRPAGIALGALLDRSAPSRRQGTRRN
jgi:hypothetical protein